MGVGSFFRPSRCLRLGRQKTFIDMKTDTGIKKLTGEEAEGCAGFPNYDGLREGAFVHGFRGVS